MKIKPSQKKSKNAKQFGMTLLEVLLALVILSTSGLAVMKVASQALNNQSYLEEKTLALWVASNYMVELQLKNQWPNEVWTDETEEFAGKEWFKRYQGVTTSNESFKALEVEVSLKPGGVALAYIRTYIAKK